MTDGEWREEATKAPSLAARPDPTTSYHSHNQKPQNALYQNSNLAPLANVGRACFVEIHTGKIHMYFVTSVLYEITCITSNTDKQDTDSNPGVWVLIYMTNTVSTNFWRQKKLTVPRSSSGGAAARAFFYITEDTCRRAGSTTRCTHQSLTNGYPWCQPHSVRCWWSQDIDSAYSPACSACCAAAREPCCALTGATEFC